VHIAKGHAVRRPEALGNRNSLCINVVALAGKMVFYLLTATRMETTHDRRNLKAWRERLDGR
jgi:hypothetical protein